LPSAFPLIEAGAGFGKKVRGKKMRGKKMVEGELLFEVGIG